MNFFDYGGYCHRKGKTRLWTWLRGLDPAIKMKVIMRINFVAIFLLFTMLHVSASIHAQKISLSADKAPLRTIFNEIEKQSGYEVWCNTKLLESSKPVTIQVTGDLKTVLDKVLSNQALSYEIVDKAIVIKAKAETFTEKVTRFIKAIKITGKITDERNKALAGVSIRIKGTNFLVVSNEDGIYNIEVPNSDAVLQFKYIGYQDLEIKVGQKAVLNVTLQESVSNLDEVGVVSTGYQTLPKERATGSFVQIDSELLNRKVSTNILERLDGIASGLLFNNRTQSGIQRTSPNTREVGFNIRGKSTINASDQPLIVIDNFPYDGEISNINPNDIASITILKDAAAASIWGARSGNGVVVITTKRGKLNQKMKVDVNSNVTIGMKPDLNYDQNYLNASDYIEVEKFLFDKGFFNADLANVTSRPTISPAVELFNRLRNSTSHTDSLSILTDIDKLRINDVREDYKEHIYQNAINQQYHIGIRGGGNALTYAFSASHDNNRANLIGNGFERTTISSINTFNPVKNLELTAGLNYSTNTTTQNNEFSFGSYNASGGKYLKLWPYALLMDESSNPLAIPRGFRSSYLTETAAKGFLDWNYRPLDEIRLSDNTIRVNDLLWRFSAKYNFLPQLSAEVQYQNERQNINSKNLRSKEMYYTRDLINRFSVYNSSTGKITYNFPYGDVLNLGNHVWNTNNARAQLNYNQSFGKHEIVAISGAEIKELEIEGFFRDSYGYDDRYGTSVSGLDYVTSFPVNPSGTGRLPSPSSTVTGQLYRYVSYYGNAAYTYDNRYTVSLSGRKDGANIFGVKANDKVTPLWSAGLGWLISDESFYKVEWLPKLKLRLTYGYNGNVHPSATAFLTGNYTTDGPTGVQVININRAPNPQLRWERVRNVNLGLDFITKDNRISGTIELYRKDALDLVQATPLAPQTGFTSYNANSASLRINGLDLTLQSQNVKGLFAWNTTLLFSWIKDRVTHTDVLETSSIANKIVEGKSLRGVFSYKWAGLNPANGNPMGYLNGVPSEDYVGIRNNYKSDSLVYSGSFNPSTFGSIRNDFSYKGFQLSVNITYQLGHVIMRSAMNPSYTQILLLGQHKDYGRRWQKPGDETNTNIPSLVYPDNPNRSYFYQYSEALIEPGDHIRLQDIRLGYTFPKTLVSNNLLERLSVYAYANNVGILWRKNKMGIDPNAVSGLPNPFSIAFGISANF